MRSRRSTQLEVPDVSAMDPWKDDRCRDFVALNTIQRLRAYHLPKSAPMPPIEDVNVLRARNLLLLPPASPDFRPCCGELPSLTSRSTSRSSHDGESHSSSASSSRAASVEPHHDDTPQVREHPTAPATHEEEAPPQDPTPVDAAPTVPLIDAAVPETNYCALDRARIVFFGASSFTSSTSPRQLLNTPHVTITPSAQRGRNERCSADIISTALFPLGETSDVKKERDQPHVEMEPATATLDGANDGMVAHPPPTNTTDMEKMNLETPLRPTHPPQGCNTTEEDGYSPSPQAQPRPSAAMTASMGPTDSMTPFSHHCEVCDALVNYYQGLLARGVVLDRYNHKDLAFAWWVVGRDMNTTALDHPGPMRREALLITIRNFYYSLLTSKRRSQLLTHETEGVDAEVEPDEEAVDEEVPSLRNESDVGNGEEHVGEMQPTTSRRRPREDSPEASPVETGDGVVEGTVTMDGAAVDADTMSANTSRAGSVARRTHVSAAERRMAVELAWASSRTSTRRVLPSAAEASSPPAEPKENQAAVEEVVTRPAPQRTKAPPPAARTRRDPAATTAPPLPPQPSSPAVVGHKSTPTRTAAEPPAVPPSKKRPAKSAPVSKAPASRNGAKAQASPTGGASTSTPVESETTEPTDAQTSPTSLASPSTPSSSVVGESGEAKVAVAVSSSSRRRTPTIAAAPAAAASTASSPTTVEVSPPPPPPPTPSPPPPITTVCPTSIHVDVLERLNERLCAAASPQAADTQLDRAAYSYVLGGEGLGSQASPSRRSRKRRSDGAIHACLYAFPRHDQRHLDALAQEYAHRIECDEADEKLKTEEMENITKADSPRQESSPIDTVKMERDDEATAAQQAPLVPMKELKTESVCSHGGGSSYPRSFSALSYAQQCLLVWEAAGLLEAFDVAEAHAEELQKAALERVRSSRMATRRRMAQAAAGLAEEESSEEQEEDEEEDESGESSSEEEESVPQTSSAGKCSRCFVDYWSDYRTHSPMTPQLRL